MDLADHRHTPDEGGVLFEGYIRYAEVEISVDEILDLFTKPKELVAAPGEGKTLEFISLLLALDWESVAYTMGPGGYIQVKLTDADGKGVSNKQSQTGFIDAETDQIRLLLAAVETPSEVDLLANQPLVLFLSDADVTDGDSPIHAKVTYRVHETGL